MELQRPAPLYQQIYELIRQKILRGEYAPGDSVQEVQTAEMLNVSRTPVREALRQLGVEGLLVANGSERTVANPVKEEFVDLYTCRAALERVVAERAARFAAAPDIEAMAVAIDEAKAASEVGDHAGVLFANTRFHDRMVESAGMPRLRQLMDNIRGPILIARLHVLSDSATEAAISKEHSRLLEAIRRRDIQAAQERMELHMSNDIERGIVKFDAS